MNRAHSPRTSSHAAQSNGRGWLSSFGRFFRRTLDEDMIVVGDTWLKDSGVQRQLEFEGYQLRWVATSKLDSNLEDGWRYVMLPHRLWWMRRVRKRHGAQQHYLLKKERSLRSQNA